MRLRSCVMCVICYAALFGAAGGIGCQPVPVSGPRVLDEAPSSAQLVEQHNQRVQLLSRVYARGVVEIRWRDEDGVRRFRQGDVDLYIDLPRRTALRVGKLAETFMWLGSDEERYWLFDLVAEERVLHVGRHDSPNAGLQTVRPLALLDLIGLGRLEELPSEHEPDVEYDRGLDAWVISGVGSGGPVRVYFDRANHLPVRAETLTAAGEIAYFSDMHMHRYRSVPVPGVSAAALPRMATLVDVFAGPGAETQGEIKLGLDVPTGRVENQPFDRVFDLERLRRSLRPERIEGDLN